MARERSGISQRRFGMMVGLSRSHVMDIESARVNITLDTLERVAHGLGVEPWELLI
ncbi:helix-turn-helix domain-containing protein [Collinsella tanakaei]|uniref:helix-turn-helix domain-containing protein n=1 Tax=Collinsella tanakaei TaxID=626935 RepID=UPI0022863618|nr:helix-turn-helix transcriptional regulator [Collinsella tanakaei]